MVPERCRFSDTVVCARGDGKAEVLQTVETPAAHALLRRGTRRYHVRIDRTSVLAPLARPGWA
jgi:hypothetical protein